MALLQSISLDVLCNSYTMGARDLPDVYNYVRPSPTTNVMLLLLIILDPYLPTNY